MYIFRYLVAILLHVNGVRKSEYASFTFTFTCTTLLLRPQRAMHSILTSRLIINVREAAIAGQGAQEYLTGTGLKSLNFADSGSSESDSDENDDRQIQHSEFFCTSKNFTFC